MLPGARRNLQRRQREPLRSQLIRQTLDKGHDGFTATGDETLRLVGQSCSAGRKAQSGQRGQQRRTYTIGPTFLSAAPKDCGAPASEMSKWASRHS